MFEAKSGKSGQDLGEVGTGVVVVVVSGCGGLKEDVGLGGEWVCWELKFGLESGVGTEEKVVEDEEVGLGIGLVEEASVVKWN